MTAAAYHPAGEHPEWCKGGDHAQLHESPRSEITGRNGSLLNVQVNDYGSGPFVSVSAFGPADVGRRGGTLIERDREMVSDLADMLDVLAGVGAKAVHQAAARLRQANVTAFGAEAEAEA
jgi:hypothetical protein